MSYPLSPILRVNRSGNSEELSAVMTLATGTAATSEVEIKSFGGKEYTVVPVVAIVEGVLHGVNATAPEFAAASEFGKFPKAWDGRPVVMNHPQLNGVFVSASIPEVLEDFGMGMLFNSRLDGKKLKCEAWLDHEAITAKGGEMLSTLERINSGEVVEVSVGAWIDAISRPGTFEGKKFSKEWKNVAPDHLAFLSEGTKGACSVEDGCGVPRLFSVNAASIGSQASCCEGCSSGEGCESAAAGPGVNEAENQLLGLEHQAELLEGLVDLLLGSAEFEDSDLSVNAIPNDMDFKDAKTIVWQGLLELLNISPYDVDMIACTSGAVVYHQWGRSGLHMRTYSIDTQANITFSEDEVPVNLLTRILPRQTTEPSVNSIQENEMAGNSTGGTQQNAAETPAAGTGAPAQQESQQVAEPVVEAAPKAPTFEELLAAADPATREAIQSGISANASRRKELVTSLVACERCKYTEEQLNDANRFGLSDLENMAEMAQVASFSGRAVPTEQEGISTNAASSGSKTVAAPANYLVADASASAASE